MLLACMADVAGLRVACVTSLCGGVPFLACFVANVALCCWCMVATTGNSMC